ncbi:hypothetical protein NPIL_8561 [Nephila pilipes]|uniref:Uncharacterized protein n=1 Tax=Nephila pilipes TaxID=299642 RepID=A0A8X6Q7X5_NEPPI|nr:hypothetical protein NPIL_8561 [Nephila pilipes]
MKRDKRKQRTFFKQKLKKLKTEKVKGVNDRSWTPRSKPRPADRYFSDRNRYISSWASSLFMTDILPGLYLKHNSMSSSNLVNWTRTIQLAAPLYDQTTKEVKTTPVTQVNNEACIDKALECRLTMDI